DLFSLPAVPLFFLAEEDLAMLEVPTDEVVTDPVGAPEEEPRDSGVNSESPISMTAFAFFFFCL
ncbi:hypothetical protein ABTD35_19300, partial [Acinetobacter baumannii]